MNIYLANASCDWGHIFQNKTVEGSNFGVAFRRAGGIAQKEARRRPRQITITVRRVGTKGKVV